MVGLVVVSHSAQIAEGVVALARQMAGDDVPIEAAGGLDEPPDAIGTDAMRVMRAIERAGAGGDGVLVLMDLGSAVLSAEMAMTLLAPELTARTLLCAAPLVEGAVAAAVAAGIGGSLNDVAREARGGLAGKEAQLVDDATAAPTADSEKADASSWVTVTLDVSNPNGLHARPAARFVQLAASFDAQIEVTNATTGAGPARAASLTEVAALGAVMGHRIVVRAHGPQADAAIGALQQLAGTGFGDSGSDTGLQPPRPATPPEPAPPQFLGISPDGSLQGLAAAPGAVVGPARRLVRPRPAPRTPGDPAVERAALAVALDRARQEVAFARESVASQVGDAHAAMLDAHAALLDDPSVIEPTERAIANGTRAEEAWSTAIAEAATRLAELDDPYLRARAEDVRDVGRRVLSQFAGAASGPPRLRGPGILIARELGAGETAMLDLSQVSGIAVATGSPTSHAAILARALGIPAVVGVGEILTSIGEEQEILVDGDRGVVRIGPDRDTVARVRAERDERTRAAAAAATRATEPAVTRDGVAIEVAANVAAPDEVAAAVVAGADGVGLFRTEFLFMGRDEAPAEDEHESAYRAAAEALGARRLLLRTFDAGGDKPVPYLALAHEDNPFLGQRGIRVSLARADVFGAQLRAALRVAADHRVAIMFPMVATLAEFCAAREHVDRAREALISAGHASGPVELGVMIEVPSAALCSEVLAREVDFFSIGTNDLTQYTLAAERGNPAVADLADGLHPSVLRLIAMVCDAARTHDRWVGVCGELAGDPLAVAPLVGLGVRELSVSTPRIAETKDQVRRIEAVDAEHRVRELLTLDSAEAVRSALSTD